MVNYSEFSQRRIYCDKQKNAIITSTISPQLFTISKKYKVVESVYLFTSIESIFKIERLISYGKKDGHICIQRREYKKS